MNSRYKCNTIHSQEWNTASQTQRFDIYFVSSIWTRERRSLARATEGGLIHYPEDVGKPTADLLNSVILTEGTELYATTANINVSNFYLMTPIKLPEFKVGEVKL